MKDFIDSNGGIIPSLLVVSLVMNAFLSFLYVVLGKLKEMIPTDTDNKIWDIVGAFLEGTHKFIEILSANPQHK